MVLCSVDHHTHLSSFGNKKLEDMSPLAYFSCAARRENQCECADLELCMWQTFIASSEPRRKSLIVCVNF